jgi:hypothetical protein
MTSEIIGEFYNEIFSLLKEDISLSNKIHEIYMKPILDPIMPCIICELNQAKNLSNRFQFIYEISFLVNILIKDMNILYNQGICNKIIEILNPANFDLSHFEITGIKYNDISIVPSKDMITTKSVISYKALIKKEFL